MAAGIRKRRSFRGFWRNFKEDRIAKIVDQYDRLFHRDSVFCFTCDTDWAPEAAIARTIEIFSESRTRPTFFVTNPSSAIKEGYRNSKERVGVHPNFMAGSTHGDNLESQIATVKAIWPTATSFRAHAYFDNTVVTRRLYAAGFEYDSNAFQFMQPYLTPQFHHTGLARFPVFWEDDIHPTRYKFTLSSIERYLAKPGLKVFNFHPLWVALNIPSEAFYEEHKFLTRPPRDAEIEKYVFQGVGAQSFLRELLSFVAARGYSVQSLSEMYADLLDRLIPNE